MSVRLPLIVLISALLAGCGAAAAPAPTAAPTVPPTETPADQAEAPAAHTIEIAPGIRQLEPPQELVDFMLTDQNGEMRHLDSLKGKTSLVAFGYTHCPDVCPITLARFKQIKLGLGEAAEDVQFVFISVDGARDTPERLAEYLSMFDSSFIGLTGDPELVREVISQYGGLFIINDAAGLKKNYTVDHSSSNYLLDAEGRWQRTYSYDLNGADIAKDVLAFLAAGA
jgi:protein SCO1/2